jgi:hypothetical protein
MSKMNRPRNGGLDSRRCLAQFFVHQAIVEVQARPRRRTLDHRPERRGAWLRAHGVDPGDRLTGAVTTVAYIPANHLVDSH